MKRWRLEREARGAVLPLTAALIIIAGGLMALAIDLGHIFLVKSELQRAADAGAMGGALGLMGVPAGTRSPVAVVPDCNRAVSACQALVTANQADGAVLQLPAGDISFGQWDAVGAAFTATGCAVPQQVNAVKVVVRRDGTANGPVLLFFAGFLPAGLSSVNLTAQAVGLTGYAGYAPPGAGALPLAVDDNKVPPGNSYQMIRIHLNPTPLDSGAWYTAGGLQGASDMRKWINGSIPSPPLRVGDVIDVMQGVADSVLQELGSVFQSKQNKGEAMDVLMPVIPAGQHSGTAPILGFVAFHITDVQSQGSDKYVEGYTVPNYVAPGVAPGGPNCGLWAGVPKLVQ